MMSEEENDEEEDDDEEAFTLESNEPSAADEAALHVSRACELLGTIHREAHQYSESIAQYQAALLIRQQQKERNDEQQERKNQKKNQKDNEHNVNVSNAATDENEETRMEQEGNQEEEPESHVYGTPECAALHNSLGFVYQAANQDVEAIGACQQALSLMDDIRNRHGNPNMLATDREKSHYCCANSHRKLQQWKEAATHFEQAFQLQQQTCPEQTALLEDTKRALETAQANMANEAKTS
uniref:Tetratricopeptide SHNi-TPR domain-containing protein n=1 Tax=Entomoneis paludosa TaxID=265537 RepID=A0A7S2VG68_9STRA|mmetsp:Transcript_17268/g.35772  ORF Transcript_17268/g.35772 Transcript_17268/m.35772 type:complete len:240 (+) Transcript_17268:248-967(+)